MPERCEDLAADAEIRVAHMSAFNDIGQGQRDAAELVGSHGDIPEKRKPRVVSLVQNSTSNSSTSSGSVLAASIQSFMAGSAMIAAQ